MQYKRPESVVVVVYTLDSKVLMLRRRFPDNFWQSVTGSLEREETPAQAAARELREETGLVSRQIQNRSFAQEFEIYPIWRHRYEPGITRNLEHVFTLALDKPVDIQLDLSEHQEYAWFDIHQAAELATSYTNRDAILNWVPKQE